MDERAQAVRANASQQKAMKVVAGTAAHESARGSKVSLAHATTTYHHNTNRLARLVVKQLVDKSQNSREVLLPSTRLAKRSWMIWGSNKQLLLVCLVNEGRLRVKISVKTNTTKSKLNVKQVVV